jgi:hypothetical protein
MTSDTTTPEHGINGQLGRVAGRSDKGKPIMHTIDPNFILGIARVSAFGAKKYHMRNFLMAPGMRWSQVYDSLMRHLMAYWAGEELDVGPNGEFGETDDPATNMQWSGLPHIDMVAWNVMVLCTYRNHSVFHPGDDRPSTLEYDGGIWKEWEAEFDAIRMIDAKAEPLPEEKSALELTAPYSVRMVKDIPQSTMDEMKGCLKALGYEGEVSYDPVHNVVTLKL